MNVNMNKRRPTIDINPSKSKRIKLNTSSVNERHSVAECVLSTPELLDNILAACCAGVACRDIFDTPVAIKAIQTSFTTRMLAFASKSIYETCVGCADRNYHSVFPCDYLKAFAAFEEYDSCFEYLIAQYPKTSYPILTGSKSIIEAAVNRDYYLSSACRSRVIERGDLKSLKIINTIINARRPTARSNDFNNDAPRDYIHAAEFGHIELLKYMQEELGVEPTPQAFYKALRRGKLECAKYIQAELAKVPAARRHEKLSKNAMILNAAASGDLECIKYCVENYFPKEEARFMTINSLLTSDRSNEEILKCIDYLVEKGFSMRDPTIWLNACTRGLLTVLKTYWSLNRDTFGNLLNVDKALVARSAQGGLECLMFAHECFGIMPVDTALYIRRDDVDTFEYFLETCQPVILKDDTDQSWLSVRTLKVAQEKRLALTPHLYIQSIKADDVGSFNYLLNSTPSLLINNLVIEHALRSDQKFVKILHKSGRVNWDTIPMDSWIHGSTEAIKYGIDKGICNVTMADFAKFRLDLDIVRFMHRRGTDLHPLLCTIACWKGKIGMLVYAHKGGLPITEHHALRAVDSGSIKCLEYLRKNGVPLKDHSLIDSAIIHHSKRMFKYLIENGCPYNARECMELLLNRELYNTEPTPSLDDILLRLHDFSDK